MVVSGLLLGYVLSDSSSSSDESYGPYHARSLDSDSSSSSDESYGPYHARSLDSNSSSDGNPVNTTIVYMNTPWSAGIGYLKIQSSCTFMLPGYHVADIGKATLEVAFENPEKISVNVSRQLLHSLIVHIPITQFYIN